MFDLIVNPIAGGKHGKVMAKKLALIESRLLERNVDYKIHYSKIKGDATKICKTLIDNGATDIIAVGGDGTLHEVINGFDNFENVNMGIIPCGTGNDFASSLMLPLDVVKAVDIILDNTPKFTDFMQMPTVRGLNIIGVGMDVEVLKKYEQLKKKTKFGYTKCLLKTLFAFKCIKFDAQLDGNKDEYLSYIAGVANGKMFGGGLQLCPVADVSDGALDFVSVGNMSKLKLIFAFLKLKKGKILKIKQTRHKRAESIKVELNQPYTVNVDGELYENIPFSVQIMHNKLKVYRV